MSFATSTHARIRDGFRIRYRPWTTSVASVRPVPFPFSFVVKQGSSIRTCGGRLALARFLARAPTEPDVRD